MKNHFDPRAGAAGRSGDCLLAVGAIPLMRLPSLIELSWRRCLDFGLDTGQGSEFEPSARDILAEQLDKNGKLLAHAQPVMKMLFEQIVDTQNMVVLANDAGYILHSMGDGEFLERAERVALAPGVEWSEVSRGTNAIGTAVAVASPVVVHGDQHFLAANQFLTCSAAPIFDPAGRLAGVLDVTGDHRSFSQHTLALVRMSVQMIENRMFAAAYADALVIRFHARLEFIGTLCEGMVAVGWNGRLLSANRNACAQFDRPLESLRGADFAALFGQPIARVFDHLLVRPQDTFSLTLDNGGRVQARADFQPHHLRRYTRLDLPSQAAVVGSPSAAGFPADTPPQTRRAGKDACPLSRLQTGDPQVDAVITRVRKVVGHDIPLLIQGETGTGKERLAYAIHSVGPRAARPFVAVNCAAIPEGLIESELFGYEEGAFTGARRKGSVGRLLQADGGTLFLDEIGDMPLSLQARLLRVLQERVVQPLGSAKSYAVDIAVICATHRRIRDLVRSGQFREDLYFRLNGFTVTLPPLRLRTDLETLVAAMFAELGSARPPTIDPEVLELFRRHPWPGNLRQLSNLLRTAAVMAAGEQMIRREHLPDDFLEDIEQQPVVASGAEPAPVRLDDLAIRSIREAIARHGGNVSAAARELGVSRATVYRKRQH
ncbi:MAG: sigma-54-dependent Fis family transcriptional regulator [Rhodocyclales bacterium]|nr:sigma-54-dependent Fis family transcriptional regulator [Rhodocyclales bacterium]